MILLRTDPNSIQPVDQSREIQLEQWRQLLVDWHKYHNKTELIVSAWPHFENPDIKSEQQRLVSVLFNTSQGD